MTLNQHVVIKQTWEPS